MWSRFSPEVAWQIVVDNIYTTTPRPGLHPAAGTKPVTLEALILPPLMYYVALLFLPPAPPPAVDTTAFKILRNTLAAIAGVLFFRLPLNYHIVQSIGLNYQLSLVGLYGGCRVIDAFFISPILFNHVPKRVRFEHQPRVETPMDATDGRPAETQRRRMGYADGGKTPEVWDRRPSLPIDSYFPIFSDAATGAIAKTFDGPSMEPVLQIQTAEDGWPHTFIDRASWALEMELSMRGTGFTWTTADVRHTQKTWLPTIHNRLHSIFVHVLPVMVTCLAIIRHTYDKYLATADEYVPGFRSPSRFDTELSLGQQLLLTAALGSFLMVAFSLAHSVFAIVCSPLAPSPFAFFPPLYTTPVWQITSVRAFWSYGWHRLFGRLFLVYGVWPGQWIERRLTGKRADEPADVGKVIGGFLSSAVVHSFSVRSVLGGDWVAGRGEGIFFITNGLAIVLEEAVRRQVRQSRKRIGRPGVMWYDGVVGRIWWISVLLFSGRNFARGWVNAGLVREMAGR